MNKKKKNSKNNGKKNNQQFQQQTQQPQELSYYRLSLLSFLRESHPELVNDTDFIATRGDSAAEAYSEAILTALPTMLPPKSLIRYCLPDSTSPNTMSLLLSFGTSSVM